MIFGRNASNDAESASRPGWTWYEVECVHCGRSWRWYGARGEAEALGRQFLRDHKAIHNRSERR